jgi:hypothetical protein
MLPVSLDCHVRLCIVVSNTYCVPYVTSFPGLSYLIVYSGVQHILCTLCYQFPWIVMLDCVYWCPTHVVYPMLPVSLDCHAWLCILVSNTCCVPYVTSFPGLSYLIVYSGVQHMLCTLCYQFPWIAMFDCVWWCPTHVVYPMLPVSLDCHILLCIVVSNTYCVPYVTSFSGLSCFIVYSGVQHILCTLCYQFPWIVMFDCVYWCPTHIVYPMLPVSLDCLIVYSGVQHILCTLCYQFPCIVMFDCA